jgi:hypothetical protein
VSSSTCTRCELELEAGDELTRDGLPYCSDRCAELGPKPVVLEGQRALFELEATS